MALTFLSIHSGQRQHRARSTEMEGRRSHWEVVHRDTPGDLLRRRLRREQRRCPPSAAKTLGLPRHRAKLLAHAWLNNNHPFRCGIISLRLNKENSTSSRFYCLSKHAARLSTVSAIYNLNGELIKTQSAPRDATYAINNQINMKTKTTGAFGRRRGSFGDDDASGGTAERQRWLDENGIGGYLCLSAAEQSRFQSSSLLRTNKISRVQAIESQSSLNFYSQKIVSRKSLRGYRTQV